MNKIIILNSNENKIINKSIEAFIHPGVEPLVVPDDHGEPGVPDLVIGNAEERCGIGAIVAEDDHRILHPAADDAAGGGGALALPVQAPARPLPQPQQHGSGLPARPDLFPDLLMIKATVDD